MDLKDVILKRRSIRRYTDEEVFTDILLEISKIAINAPSASNMKAWKLVIVNEKEKIEKIKRFSPGMGFTPPALIVVGIDKEKAIKKAGPIAIKEFIYYDAAIVSYNICLLALEYGLGSCILASFNRTAIGKFVNFPEEIYPVLMVSVGYPLKVPQKVQLGNMTDTIFMQNYESR